MNWKKNYQEYKDLFFSRKDLKKLDRMSGVLKVVSTVCPDYPNNGSIYTFVGDLGKKASLTALNHLHLLPQLLKTLVSKGVDVEWLILVADLPELVDSQAEFYIRVAGSKEAYIRRCEGSRQNIETLVEELDLSVVVRVETFSSFYSSHHVNYLQIQERVAEQVLLNATEDKKFSGKFNSFAWARADLAQKFRQKSLNQEELKITAAHGMSLYITHGTLLRSLFTDNLLVVNHFTPNLQNFFLASFVKGMENIENSQKFPIGILPGEQY